jgi:hypothetical protein
LVPTSVNPDKIPQHKPNWLDPTGINELDDECLYPTQPVDGQCTHACFLTVMEHTGQVYSD